MNPIPLYYLILSRFLFGCLGKFHCFFFNIQFVLVSAESCFIIPCLPHVLNIDFFNTVCLHILWALTVNILDLTVYALGPVFMCLYVF